MVVFGIFRLSSRVVERISFSDTLVGSIDRFFELFVVGKANLWSSEFTVRTRF